MSDFWSRLNDIMSRLPDDDEEDDDTPTSPQVFYKGGGGAGVRPTPTNPAANKSRQCEWVF